MELNHEFFGKLLEQFETLFAEKRVSIISCRRHSDDKIVYALAATKVDPVTKLLDFIPIAFLWDKNPMQSMSVTERPMQASQQSIDEWSKEAEVTVCDIHTLN